MIEMRKLIGFKSRILCIILLIFLSCTSNKSSETEGNSAYFTILKTLTNQGSWHESNALLKLKLKSDKQLSDQNKKQLYLMMAENYFFLEEYDLAESNYKKMLDLSNPNEDANLLGNAYYGLGDLNYLKWAYFKKADALDITKEYLDSAMFYAKKQKNKTLESKVLYRSGSLFQIQGDLDSAQKNFEKGLSLSFSISDTAGIVRNSIHKAAVFQRSKVLESALHYFKSAYQYANAVNRNFLETHALCNLGMYHFREGKIALAEDYFKQARYLAEELKHRMLLCRSYYGLALTAEASDNKMKALDYAQSGRKWAEEKAYKNYEQAFETLIKRTNEQDL